MGESALKLQRCWARELGLCLRESGFIKWEITLMQEMFPKTATKHEKYILHFSTLFINYIKYYKLNIYIYEYEILIATSLIYLIDEMKFHTENV